MHHLKRLFTTAEVKGTENYINSQKKYELIRTILYFSVSAALFIGGYLQTKSRTNLLTVVAILGCLPASKSAVSAIMFCRFKSCDAQKTSQFKAHSRGLQTLYDCVFTSYKTNYQIAHLAVCGNTICGYAEEKGFPEKEFENHITEILKRDGQTGITIKIFTDPERYVRRLDQLQTLETNDTVTSAVIETLKSVML